MAIISDPFVATGSKQLSNEDLVQAVRADIIGEYEAVIGYEAHALAATDNRVKQILYQIADDEKKHVGQLLQLLQLLNPKEQQLIDQGRQTAQQNLSAGGSQSMQQGVQQNMQPTMQQ
jgi:rubrerythrin